MNLWIEVTRLADDEGLKALLEYVLFPCLEIY